MRPIAEQGMRSLLEQGEWHVPGLGLRLTWRAGQGTRIAPARVSSQQRRTMLALVARFLRDGRYLKRCPQCGTPFIAKGKRRFCKLSCTRLAMDQRKAVKRIAAYTRKQARRYKQVTRKVRRLRPS